MSDEQIQRTVAKWLETIVIGLNLCPFAKREVLNQTIRYAVSPAESLEALIDDVVAELITLRETDSIETSLIILPKVLQNFDDFNQFLGVADELLHQLKLDGVIQVASFHPNYQFADTKVDDVENTTNKSPYPILHLLREDSLETAIENHSDTDLIPEANVQRVQAIGADKMSALLRDCFVNTPA